MNVGSEPVEGKIKKPLYKIVRVEFHLQPPHVTKKTRLKYKKHLMRL